MTVSYVDDYDDESYGAASNAIMLKYGLMRVANIKNTDAIINKDDSARKDSEDFQYVVKHRWSNNLARVALMRRRLDAKIRLPVPHTSVVAITVLLADLSQLYGIKLINIVRYVCKTEHFYCKNKNANKYINKLFIMHVKLKTYCKNKNAN